MPRDHPMPVSGGMEAGQPAVVRGFTSSILEHVRSPTVAAAMWRRFGRRRILFSSYPLLRQPAFRWESEGSPSVAARRLFADIPYFPWALSIDVTKLALCFARVTGAVHARLRLEHVDDDACRKFHVDQVGYRLLCTYVGPGTEWLDEGGITRHMWPMEVAILKGSKVPGDGPRVLHRSPPISQLPPDRRSRLVLCIDQGD